ncbi:NPP1 family protein [Bacillus sonorensis]|nr:NPP1 family protein [Bacillus sonorensis]
MKNSTNDAIDKACPLHTINLIKEEEVKNEENCMCRTVTVIFSSASLVPTANAGVIDHDKVVGFKEVAPSTVSQKAAKRFQPYLKVYSGCVPFPAVDAQGNTSGGLEPTGAPEGHCSKNTGQVYTRSAWYNGVWAIMYSWYFPKDEASPGLGHRHDWEGIVVWVDNPANQNPKALSVAYSGHGKFTNAALAEPTWKMALIL